jgi:flagellin-like protein
MEIKELLTEDRAVSPVIGVILMVAITVILAAVIGTFVLGLGQNVNSTPQASFSFDFEPNGGGSGYNVTIAHEGGDALTTDNTQSLEVAYTGTGGNAQTSTWASAASDFPVEAGNQTSLTGSSAVQADTTVRVVWTGPNGENTATLGSQGSPS